MADNGEVIDLHDLALLLNYERASMDSRFRNAKLTEIACDEGDYSRTNNCCHHQKINESLAFEF